MHAEVGIMLQAQAVVCACQFSHAPIAGAGLLCQPHARIAPAFFEPLILTIVSRCPWRECGCLVASEAPVATAFRLEFEVTLVGGEGPDLHVVVQLAVGTSGGQSNNIRRR